MDFFKVDANFYLDHDVDYPVTFDELLDELLSIAVDHVHQVKITFDERDSIVVRFIVESGTYEHATQIAKNYLAQLETQINAWFSQYPLALKVEDESLLLMPA